MARKKITVLGGGIGALSAVHGLTSKPGWEELYDIDVYQLGWRLGGKCATGRNEKENWRIEEHGLHVWGGYYANAFSMMRQCYKELNRPPDAPLATWEDAFKRQSLVTIEEYINGQWLHWQVPVPTNGNLPGDGEEMPSLEAYLSMAVQLIENLVKDLVDHLSPEKDEFFKTEVAAGVALVAGIEMAQNLVSPTPHSVLIDKIESVFEQVKDRIDSDPIVRRAWICIDLGKALVGGCIADGVFSHGWNAVEEIEWSAWLKKHGASDLTLQSPLVRAIYDTVFGFKDGDSTGFLQGNMNCRALSARSIVHGVFRFVFTYKGAIFWEMQAGMAETVFTPLYQVLKTRGVRFHFFSRIKDLGLSADKKRIETIGIGLQVTLKTPEYQPLCNVKGLGCWPSEPLYDQIVEGGKLQSGGINLESAWSPWKDVGETTLTLGAGDLVILGISVGGLAPICSSLVQASKDWSDMLSNLKTIETLAMQLWLIPDRAGLGWDFPQTMLTTYQEPWDTWADLSHLIQWEDWGAPPPGSAAYFCGPMSTPLTLPPGSDYSFPAMELNRVRQSAGLFLGADIGHLWPKATLPNSQAIDPKLIVSQYVRANVNPSDRYVACEPNTNQFRLEADKSGFDNLYLAGDWVFNSLNYGCLEAAVMTGFRASRAICGFPAVIVDDYDSRQEQS